MGAHIEWLVGVLRLGNKFNQFGDEYTLSGTVVIKGDTMEIKGASAPLGVGILKERDAFMKIIKPLGIKMVTWERYREDGTIKQVRMKVK